MTVVRILGSGQVLDMVPNVAAQYIQMGRATAVDPEKEKKVIETAIAQGHAPEQATAERQKTKIAPRAAARPQSKKRTRA